MKIAMTVRDTVTKEMWTENLDIDEADAADPGKAVHRIIDSFNATLRPGENPRELLEFAIIKTTSPISETTGHLRHDWEKQNLVTLEDSKDLCDELKCCRCGITARRYGLINVVPDKPWRDNIFFYCDTAQQYFNVMGRPKH